MSDLARHSHANFLTSDKAHYVNSRPHGPAPRPQPARHSRLANRGTGDIAVLINNTP